MSLFPMRRRWHCPRAPPMISAVIAAAMALANLSSALHETEGFSAPAIERTFKASALLECVGKLDDNSNAELNRIAFNSIQYGKGQIDHGLVSNVVGRRDACEGPFVMGLGKHILCACRADQRVNELTDHVGSGSLAVVLDLKAELPPSGSQRGGPGHPLESDAIKVRVGPELEPSRRPSDQVRPESKSKSSDDPSNTNQAQDSGSPCPPRAIGRRVCGLPLGAQIGVASVLALTAWACLFWGLRFLGSLNVIRSRQIAEMIGYGTLSIGLFSLSFYIGMIGSGG